MATNIPAEGHENSDGDVYTCTLYAASESYSMNQQLVPQKFTFGGQDDLMGASLSSSQINDPSFGISLKFQAGANGATVKVKSVRLKMYYQRGIGSEEIDQIRPSSYAAVCTGGNGVRIIVGANGVIKRDLNGGGWSSQTSGVTEDLLSCIWDGAQFIVGGRNGVILTSPDGITWTRVVTDNYYSVYAIEYRIPSHGVFFLGPTDITINSKDLSSFSYVVGLAD